jgi:hypothetical protein
LAGCVARVADRRDDWSVFGFETALDPKFARAQRRYLGASGSVDHNGLRGWIPATAFTMSIPSMSNCRPGRSVGARSTGRLAPVASHWTADRAQL